MDALRVLRGMIAHRSHVFWPADVDLSEWQQQAMPLMMGHQQVTDSYLVALAAKRKGRVITFDKGMAALVPRELSKSHVVEVVHA